MSISAQDVKALREQTGAGMMDCKNALVAAEGDIEKARMVLREKGLAKAQKRSGREATEGVVYCYTHGERLGVMLELCCETDFVGSSDAFKELAHNLALQVAAMKPEYISSDEVPADVVEAERGLYRKEVADKPEQIQDKIIEGKLGKFYQQICLLNQLYVRDDKLKVQDVITDVIGICGENIVVRRFARMELGGK
jgi:elongation factor Ts